MVGLDRWDIHLVSVTLADLEQSVPTFLCELVRVRFLQCRNRVLEGLERVSFGVSVSVWYFFCKIFLRLYLRVLWGGSYPSPAGLASYIVAQ